MKILTRKNFQRVLFVLACLVTLVFVLWQFENFRGRRAWQKYKNDALAKGQAVEPKQVIPPPVPDASNFAAIDFFKPLFDFEPGTQNYKDEKASEAVAEYFDSMPQDYQSKQPTSNTWVAGVVDLHLFTAEIKEGQSAITNGMVTPAISADQAAGETLAFLSKFDEALNQIEQAASRPDSRFPIAYDTVPSVNALLPHLKLLRSVARVLCVRAAARLELGQTDAAARDILLIWRLGDSVKTEPMIISHLVRVAILQSGFQPLADGISRKAWSDSQLDMFQRELLSRNVFSNLRELIAGEAAFMGATIDQVRSGFLKSDHLGDPDVLRGWPDGWYYLEMVNYHRLMDSFEQSIPRQPIIDPQEIERLTEKNTNFFGDSAVKSFLKHSVFSRLLFPALQNILKRTSSIQNGVQIAALACALERHRSAKGAYPESLDALQDLLGKPVPPDVIKGRPLIYRREGNDSYILYSVGWDGKDDGGKVPATGADSEKVPEDRVWRPLQSR